jgi:hypothetical protein
MRYFCLLFIYHISKLVLNVKHFVQLQALSVDQEIIVCSPVLVLFENGKHADVLGLPWHPAISQSYQLKVHGGITSVGLNLVKKYGILCGGL